MVQKSGEKPVERLVVYIPLFTQALAPSQVVIAGFLNHQQYLGGPPTDRYTWSEINPYKWPSKWHSYRWCFRVTVSYRWDILQPNGCWHP